MRALKPGLGGEWRGDKYPTNRYEQGKTGRRRRQCRQGKHRQKRQEGAEGGATGVFLAV